MTTPTKPPAPLEAEHRHLWEENEDEGTAECYVCGEVRRIRPPNPGLERDEW